MNLFVMLGDSNYRHYAPYLGLVADSVVRQDRPTVRVISGTEARVGAWAASGTEARIERVTSGIKARVGAR
jgi:hypothetical protein